MPTDTASLGPQRQRKLSKERILSAASKIPYHDLTIGRLARELDVTAPAIYSYFAGIDAIRAALALQSIEDADYLDDQPLGNFGAFMIRFLKDFRGFLDENHLEPALFNVDFGASRLRDQPSIALLKRLEHFLGCAEENGISPQAAMPMYWFLTDIMAHASWITIERNWVTRFRSKLEEDISGQDENRFPQIRAYLSGGGNSTLDGDALFLIFATLVGKALAGEFQALAGESGSSGPTRNDH